MSMTSKIGALFFKHHQSEAKRAKKTKRPVILSLPDRHVARQQNGPAISQQVPVTSSPLRPPSMVRRLDALPDDLPTVTAPPPGTAALEEPDTIHATWGDVDDGSNMPNWCRLLCCKSPEETL